MILLAVSHSAANGACPSTDFANVDTPVACCAGQLSCFEQRERLAVTTFNYAASADLYPSRVARGSAKVTYRRFGRAADALRYAIEDMPTKLLRGTLLEVDERRFTGDQIRELYDASAYPLDRSVAP